MKIDMKDVRKRLRFYFITDHGAPQCSMSEQVHIALAAGATIIQYRNKQFDLQAYEELLDIRTACRKHHVPLLINDDVLLAKAVDADGVHLGQGDDTPQLARRILGPQALVGLSVSSVSEMEKSCLDGCDYLGCGPVFPTGTKPDAQPACHLNGLKQVARKALLPVVAIGGINAKNAAACLNQGASGVAVISAITRSPNPKEAARRLAAVCEI